MSKQQTKKRERQRTPNNPTTTGFRISDELWAALQPLLPVHVNTHRGWQVDDRVCLIETVPTQSSLSCAPDASGKLWTRPSCARIRQRTIVFKSGWKRTSS